jgi:hypothetical protein
LRSSTALPVRPLASSSEARSFPDARTSRSRCLVPPRAVGSHSAWRFTRFPVTLGCARLGRPGRTASPASKRSSFSESVHVDGGEPHAYGRCSPGFLPLQRPCPCLGASTRPGPSACAPAPRRAHRKQALPGASDREDHQPPRLGESSPQRCPKTSPGPPARSFAVSHPRRQPATPFEVAPRRLSTASPSPPVSSHGLGEPGPLLRPSELRSAGR